MFGPISVFTRRPGIVGACLALGIAGTTPALAATYHESSSPDGGAHSWSESGGLHVDITDAKCDGYGAYVLYMRVGLGATQRLNNNSGCGTNVRKPASSSDTSWTTTYVTTTKACNDYPFSGDSCDSAWR